MNAWLIRAGRGAAYLEDFITKNFVALGWSELGNRRKGDGRLPIGTDSLRRFPDRLCGIPLRSIAEFRPDPFRRVDRRAVNGARGDGCLGAL